MNLSSIYNGKKDKIISYEVFPPKNDNIEGLIDELKNLCEHKPSLISVTYGAGGSNREKSLEIVKRIKTELKQTVMPHFTCVCSSKDYIEKYLTQIENLGIKNILALRGDEPEDIEVCYKDFKSAIELIEFLKKHTELEFAVAAYPEKHPKAPSFRQDIETLKKKQDLGAKVAFTQLFFINENFYRYFDLCKEQDMKIPLIPGILPVVSFLQFQRMIELSGVNVPPNVLSYFKKYENSKEDTIKAGIEFASNQCQKLLEFGVEGLHFYTLNKSKSVHEIIKNIIC